MQITVTIPDEQWQEFQQLAQEAVEARYDGNYEDFATYIMTANISSYIESQKRRQAKKMKQALASYEESMAKETQEATVSIAKPEPAPKVPVKKRPEDKPKSMTNVELSERIAQLEETPVRQRTLAEAQELNDLHILRKQRARKK